MAIYEALHPETRNGGDRKSDQVANSATRSVGFTPETAKAIEKAETTIRQATARGAALGDDLEETAGTGLESAGHRPRDATGAHLD